MNFWVWASGSLTRDPSEPAHRFSMLKENLSERRRYNRYNSKPDKRKAGEEHRVFGKRQEYLSVSALREKEAG